MINHWWVTRPKRKLNSVPEVLACCASYSLDNEWRGNVYSHVAFEKALEDAGLKRVGERRDQRGGGGRTYFAWLSSLGLVFEHEATKQIKLTLAGEALLNGESPAEVLKWQVLKYQFPSPFSLSPKSSKSRVSERFKIRPFRFLLQLLREPKLGCQLSQEEIARIVIVEAENESDQVYKYIVERILAYRDKGADILAKDFLVLYSSKVNYQNPYGHLDDVANTIINWLEYTQLILRDQDDQGRPFITIAPEKICEVDAILNDGSRMIERATDQEYFQRKYGLDAKHQKDTRNLLATKSVSAQMISEQMIRQAFLSEALKSPIYTISSELVSRIAHKTGIVLQQVEDTLLKLYPHGAIGSFMSEYYEMAFKGRDEATDFEKATVEIFSQSFGFKAQHVGPIGLTPDVLILSDSDGYQAIIDNKAYSKYSITNDHYNRMVHNYIGAMSHYSNSPYGLAFFSYIAGGFGSNIGNQLNRISTDTGIPGSAVSVSNIIKMVERSQTNPYTHAEIRKIFSVNRLVGIEDL